MTVHVDIVKNESDAGLHIRIGCVRVSGARLDVERFDTEQCWEETVWNIEVVEPETGARVDPHVDAERYLELLHTAMNLPFLFATEVHPADQCPFSGWKQLPEERPGGTNG